VLSVTYAIRSTPQDAPLVADLLAAALASGGAGMHAALAAYGVPLRPKLSLQAPPGIVPHAEGPAGAGTSDAAGAPDGAAARRGAGAAAGALLGAGGLLGLGGAVFAAARWRRRRRALGAGSEGDSWKDSAAAALMVGPASSFKSSDSGGYSAAPAPAPAPCKAAAVALVADAAGAAAPSPPAGAAHAISAAGGDATIEPGGAWAPPPPATAMPYAGAPVLIPGPADAELPGSPAAPRCAPLLAPRFAPWAQPQPAPLPLAPLAPGGAAWAAALGLRASGDGVPVFALDSAPAAATSERRASDAGSGASSYHTGDTRSIASSVASGSDVGSPRSSQASLWLHVRAAASSAPFLTAPAAPAGAAGPLAWAAAARSAEDAGAAAAGLIRMV
jgi:hypothetical protein